MIMQEDSFRMTREDMMRELELLPVWKLRAPLPTAPIANIQNTVLVESVENKQAEVEATELILIEKVAINTAVLIFSEDKKWTFVLPETLQGESAELFNNILRALKIKALAPVASQQLSGDIAQSHANVVIAMGEIVAQKLLNSIEPIEKLRGKLHAVNGAQIVVTYHPDDLLQHLPNKAKTWDDLCLALNELNA